MAGKNIISFNIKLDVDGKNLKILADDAEGLKTVMKGTVVEADKVKKSLLNWSQATQAMASISSVMKDVSGALNDLSDKMKSVQHESMLVANLTGKTGEEMTKLRNGVKTVSDYFGTDFNSTMQAANALSKGFGISIDDALKLMRDGFVSGANANGDFVDTLREYPRYFKEAGLSAEEFIAISTNAAKQGIYSDKGVDVIKEGNIRIREMTAATADALNAIGISASDVQTQLQAGTITTFEVMQQVAAKLNELPASASVVGTAIADIFGGPGEDAGLEYIKSLSTAQLNMEALKASTNGLAEQQEKQLSTQEGIKNSLSGLIDLSGIYANVQPYVDLAAQIGLATVGISSFMTTIKAALPVLTAMQLKTKLAGAAALLCGINSNQSAALVRVFSAAMTTGAYSVTAFKIALKGLLISTGIGIAIVALTSIVEAFISSTEEAAEETDTFQQELEDLKKTSTDISSTMAQSIQKEITELDRLVTVAKNEAKSREERTKAITELQSKYPEYFNNLNAEKLDIDALNTGYNNLRNSILATARARAIGLKIEENTGKILENEEKLIPAKQLIGKYINPGMSTAEKRKAWRKAYEDGSLTESDRKMLAEADKLLTERKELQKSNEWLIGELEKSNQSTFTPKPTFTPKGTSISPTAPTSNEDKQETLIADPQSINELKHNLSLYQKLKGDAKTDEDRIKYTQEITAVNELIKKLEELGIVKEEIKEKSEPNLAEQSLNQNASNIRDIEKNISILNAQLETASIEEAIGLNQNIALWQQKADAIRNAGKAAEVSKVSMTKSLIDIWGGVKNVSGSIQGMVDAIEGSGTVWEKTIAVVDAFIGVYQGIQSIISIIQAITGVTTLLTGAKTAEAVAVTASASATVANAATMGSALTTTLPTVAANKVLAASYKELAAAEYMAAHAYIPFAGFGIAMGFTSAMMAAVAAAGIPMLAEGGVASGPTLAMVGEYAGASNNPEVIAPLNKLRGILADSGGLTGEVIFKIRGRNLVGILNKENERINRS